MPGQAGTPIAIILAFVRGPFAAAMLIVGAFALGTWGYLTADLNLSASEAIYGALRLFNTDNLIPLGAPSPWQIDVAQFMAPLSIAYAALSAVFAVLREQTQRLRTRLFARDHVVVVGLGSRGSRLIRALRDSHTLVGIDNGAAESALKGLSYQATVIRGDGRDPAVLRAARVDRAAHLVILVDDDSTSLEVVAAANLIVDRHQPVTFHVAVRGVSLWAELHRLPLIAHGARRRVEFFSVPDQTAARLVESLSQAVDGLHSPTIALRGEGPTAARTIVRALRGEGGREIASIHLTSEDPDAVLTAVAETDKWAAERIHTVSSLPNDLEPEVILVAGYPEAQALSEATGLARRFPNAELITAVQDVDVSNALEGTGVELTRVTLVPVEAAVLSKMLLESSTIETVARARHAEYVAQQTARGDTQETNTSLVSWEELPDSLREANRRFAEGVASALAELGAEVVPLSGAPSASELDLPEPVLERLAYLEHERWRRDHERDGWTRTSGPKDPERKLHPLLIDWEQLDESDREKDRDGIRGLPKLVADAGYEIKLPRS